MSFELSCHVNSRLTENQQLHKIGNELRKVMAISLCQSPDSRKLIDETRVQIDPNNLNAILASSTQITIGQILD